MLSGTSSGALPALCMLTWGGTAWKWHCRLGPQCPEPSLSPVPYRVLGLGLPPSSGGIRRILFCLVIQPARRRGGESLDRPPPRL